MSSDLTRKKCGLLLPIILGVFIFLGFLPKIVCAENEPDFGNANSGEWTSRQKLQIDPNLVVGELHDFPLLITEKNISEEVFLSAQDSGCDLRFTFATDGSIVNETSFEIVNFNKSAKSAEIWVKVPLIADDATTSIWIWWGNGTAECYSADHIFGRNNVWNSYNDVFHLNESAGTSALNSVGAYNGIYKGDVPNTARGGKIGNAQDFDGIGDKIFTDHILNLDNNDFTIGAWIYADTFGDNSIISRWGGNGFLSWTLRTDWSTDNSNRWTFGYSTNGWGGTEVFKYGAKHVAGEWFYITATRRNNHLYIGANGIEVDTGIFDKNIYGELTKGIYIGGSSGYSEMDFDGLLDEVRVKGGVGHSIAWIQTEYNNQNSPENFVFGQEVKNVGEDQQDKPFSFTHLTDIHLGSSWVPGHRWHEELSYPRFTDALYEIGQLAEKPDFLFVSGDIVEYSNDRWFKDYRSLIEGFTAQTGIAVHTVPGNHDRYWNALGSTVCDPASMGACGDELAAYKELVSANSDFNFTHKGLEFIGLDSGADYLADYEIGDLIGDKGIESDGLSDEQMAMLAGLDAAAPKVVFMHSPVISGNKDECAWGACPQSILEDASFANKHQEFLDWALASNLQLVLAGHTHRDEAYNSDRYQYFDIANAQNDYPLYIQTQSATHDSGARHGYRIIDVKDQQALPRAVVNTGEYVKMISRLENGNENELRVYDPLVAGAYITPADTVGLTVPFFAAASSQRVLLYGADANKLKLQVWQRGENSHSFDLSARIEGVAMADADYANDFGYHLGNSEDSQFVHFHLENKLADVKAKNISFAESSRYQFLADWNELIKTKNISNFRISKNFTDSLDVPLDLKKMRFSLIASLFSPAELAVINSAGERTGIIGHEPIEEIAYSLSDAMRERVLLYSDDDFAYENFKYLVRGLDDVYGTEDAVFGLKISHRTDDAPDSAVNISNQPINASTTYQFAIAWENLSATKGVFMEIDEDGDGIFEIKAELGADIDSVNPRAIRQSLLARLNAALGADAQTDGKIALVQEQIMQSLQADWWQNDYFLDTKKGAKVFSADLAAIRALSLYLGLDAVFAEKPYIPDFVSARLSLPENLRLIFSDCVKELSRSAGLLARIAFNDFAGKIDTKKAEKLVRAAEALMDKAQSARNLEAGQLYRRAWELVN